MTWLSKNWKKLLVAGCGVVGAISTVVPALVPATLVCAVAIPAVTSAPDVITAIKNVMEAIGPKNPQK